MTQYYSPENLGTFVRNCGKKATEDIGNSILRSIKARIKPGVPKGTRSLPGRAPNTQTGKLVRGYRVITYPGANGHVAIVQTDPERSGGKPVWFWLEFGTRKMAARPHIRVAMEETKRRRGVS